MRDVPCDYDRAPQTELAADTLRAQALDYFRNPVEQNRPGAPSSSVSDANRTVDGQFGRLELTGLGESQSKNQVQAATEFIPITSADADPIVRQHHLSIPRIQIDGGDGRRIDVPILHPQDPEGRRLREEAGARLTALANSQITDARQRERFIQDMVEYEFRSAAQGVSERAVAQMYRRLSHVLDGSARVF